MGVKRKDISMTSCTRCVMVVVCFAFFAAVPAASSGEIRIVDGVFVDGYIRPRLEIDDRDFDRSTGPDSYTTLRTRLGFRVTDIIPDTTFYILLADSRTMGYSDPYLEGENIGPNQRDADLGVNQAWLFIDNLGADGVYLKVGRMENNQGRNRLFGPGNWSHNGPRTYDGAKGGYRTGEFQINIWSLYGLNGDRHWYPDPSQFPDWKTPDPDIDYKYDHTLNGMDVRAFDEDLQFLFFVDYDQARVTDLTTGNDNPASVRYTGAVYASWSSADDWKRDGGVWLAADYAYQFGTVGTVAGEADIDAWLAMGDIAVSAGGKFQPWMGVGADVTSGDGGADRNEVHYFYDFYYSRHSYRGHMDLFKNPFAEPSLGLQDYIVRAGFKPHKSTSVQFDAHYFRTEQPFVSQDDADEAHELGYELDTTVNIKIREGLSSRIGFDVFWPSDDWKGPHGDQAHYGYAEITGTF